MSSLNHFEWTINLKSYLLSNFTSHLLKKVGQSLCCIINTNKSNTNYLKNTITIFWYSTVKDKSINIFHLISKKELYSFNSHQMNTWLYSTQLLTTISMIRLLAYSLNKETIFHKKTFPMKIIKMHQIYPLIYTPKEDVLGLN